MTKLTLISQRAQRAPRYQFTCLAHLLEVEFLEDCYLGLGRDRASGIDGVTWKEYGKELEVNLRQLVERMKAKGYKPQPVKRVYIPKSPTEKRPLGLPALEDKIVQKGIARILAAIYEVDFRDCSYGFRPGVGCHQALAAVDRTMVTGPVNHVVEADIKGFFDNISHDWMMKFLQVRLKDPSFLLLIRRFLKAGYMEGGQKVATDKGAPQGGNLSPILANIYLHYVLDLWYAKRVRRPIPGYCQLVRYADDFICMVQNQQSAQELERMLHERFAKFGLTLHTEKTRVKSFGRYERTNAARQGRKSNTFDFLGFTHYCRTSRRGDFVVGRKTRSKKFRQKCRDMTDWLKRIRHILSAKDWWPILASKLRGHYQYYGVNGNSRMLSQFYYQTMLAVFRWLNRRSQRRSFTWQRFNAYVKRYPLPTPRIMCKLYKLSPVS